MSGGRYRQYLLDCIKTEIETCKYLFSRIAPDHLAFRPREGVRSIEELLRYLTWCALGAVDYCVCGTPGRAGDTYTKYRERSETVDLAYFPALMDEQMEAIAGLITTVDDEELHVRMVTYPWRATAPLGEAIIETSIKWLAAYKMQLFLTMKLAGGNDEMNTVDCWIRPYMRPKELMQEVFEEES